MTKKAPPAGIGSSEGLGLAFPERDYLAFDPCEGDRDVDVRCRTVKMVRARKEHPCFLGAGSYGDGHTIKPGEMHRYETALVDGDYWGKYRVCVACMDKWLSELGRPRAASPNAELSGGQRPSARTTG